MAMAAGTFGVSVSLAHYFSDERARCLMAVEGARRARWLARRLRRTFALPGRVALLCRGHLLPPAEPLALLRPGDALEAIPATARVVDLSRELTSDGERPPRAKRRRSESLALPSESPAPPSMSPAPPCVSLALPSVSLAAPSGSPAPPSEPPAHPSEAPTSTALPPSPPAAECLHEVKRRALALLALHEPSHDARPERDELQQPAAWEGEGEGRRRRRRVRRRRAPPSAPAPPQGDPETEELQCGVEAPAPEQGSAEVMRNSCGGQRAARRVRALPARGPLHDARSSPSADDVDDRQFNIPLND